MSAIHILEVDSVVVSAEPLHSLIYNLVLTWNSYIYGVDLGKGYRIFTMSFLPGGAKLEYLFLRLELRYASL